MTRAPRTKSGNDVYHVVARGVGHCVIFEDDADRKRFLEGLAYLCRNEGAELFAWCLMDNHYHLLLKLCIESLSAGMKRLNSEYALYFNKRYERDGHLFQGRFKSEPVDSDEYFLTALRYVHQNPIKAGIAESCDYPWSSYRQYVQESDEFASNLASTELATEMLGGVEGFRRFHRVIDVRSTCCDIGRNRKLVADSDARKVADAVLGGVGLGSLVGLPRESRDNALRSLRAANLSVRQIERLTGISRGVVMKIRMADK